MFCVYKLREYHFLITMCTVDKTQVHSNISSLFYFFFNTAPIPGHVLNSVTLFFFHALVKRHFQLEQEYTGDW